MDGATTLILSFFEMIKSYIIVKTAKNNHEINKFSAGTSTQTHAIGFMANYDEETEEYDDDEDI